MGKLEEYPKVVKKTYSDLTGYDPANAFTVTGDVRVRVWGKVGATGITSTSGTTTMSVGTAANSAVLLPTTTIDNSQFAAGAIWVDSSPTSDVEAMSNNWFPLKDGEDIGLARSVDDITGGSLTLYCEYIVDTPGGSVVAA